MRDSFLRSVLWFLFMTCFVFGTHVAIMMKAPHYIFYAIISFGACLMFAKVWKKLSKQGFLISLVFSATLGLASKFVPRNLMYEYLNIRHAVAFHEAWIVLNLIIGVPCMIFIFRKFRA